MSFDINLICRALGDGSASTKVKNGELTWAELDANFIAIKAALKLAVSMIPTDLGVTGLGSATLFDRFNSAYSHGNAAGLTKNNELIMWGSNRGSDVRHAAQRCGLREHELRLTLRSFL
jgi:hypothetical protein